MPKHDPRIDAYIANAAPFARPILIRAREIVHAACPDVEETLKWGMPTFMHHGILCGMAAFKQHVSFGFWKHALVLGDDSPRNGMGSFGKMTKLSDLPPKRELTAYIKKAMALNERGIKAPATCKARSLKPPPTPSSDFVAALKKNKKAHAMFDAFSPTSKREYVEWINDAKRDETRLRRITQAIEWLAQGKPRNWKYLKR